MGKKNIIKFLQQLEEDRHDENFHESLNKLKEDYPPQPLPHLQPAPQPQFPPQHDIFQKLMTDAKEGIGIF